MIPSGKVTFLFTDIEGSTKLAQKDTEAYMSSLDKHHEILYDIIDSNKGFVFKIVGDSFCCAFSNPEDAVNAAIKTQLKLNSTDWGNSVIKVRMGIHSGDAEFVNQDYSGYVTLSRSQRIMSIAHGGQILITEEVYNAVRDNHENKISFRDLGERRLKDILLPEHVYQIVSEDLPSEFPPLKTQDARQNNLPSTLTEFIGRRKEINEIKQLFSKIRLLSLIGAGGTGKTRLAIQLASELLDEFDNGVWIIEFSPVTDPELVVKEISSVLNLKEDPGTDLIETLKEFLKDKKILVLFDNSEHLLNKCALVAESLLSYCPGLKIISTSREPFNNQGETLYRIPPLSMPDKIKNESFETLAEYESVKFFLERATSINSNFSLTNDNICTVAEICKKLDGIPLAIELAAKRVNVLSADKILERLNDRFRLLTGGSSTALPRQKTLKALIDWSYDLLSPPEQLLLQRLAIFMGGWTLEAAEEICSDETIDQYEVLDLMTGLHDKSLITFKESDGKGRYGILESIKYYSLEKLGGNSADYQRHLDYFLDLSAYSKQKLKKTGLIQWLSLVEPELDNIRSNMHWATDNNPDDAVRLCINAFDFWLNKGYLQEGYDTSIRMLDLVPAEDIKSRADLMYGIARFCYELGKFDDLEKYSGEALNLYREINDKEGVVKALNTLGLKYYTELDNNQASKLNEEALALSDEINSKEDKANSLYNLSFPVARLEGFEKSIALKEEALKISREIKNDHLTARVLLSLSVTCSRNMGEIRKAELYSEESLKISRKLDDNYLISVNLVHLADLKLYYENKNFEEAEYILLEAHKISKDSGYNMNLFPIWNNLGGLYIETEKYDQALNVYSEYMKDKGKPGGDFFMPDVISGFARIYYRKNEYSKAARILGFIESIHKKGKRKTINKNVSLSDEEKAKLSKELGEENYNKLRDEGEAMNMEEAIEFCVKS